MDINKRLNVNDALLNNDPERIAQLHVGVCFLAESPDLTIWDCFANIDVSVKFSKNITSDQRLQEYRFEITGKLMDLNLVVIKIDEWRKARKA